MSYCRSCDESRCRNYLENCAACDEPVCSKCRSICKGCRKLTCDGCLEEDLCPACREKVEEPHGELETPAITTAPASAATTIRQRRRNRHRALAA